MTKEEAINIINSECYVFNPLNFDRSTMVNTALDMAIKALDQEPCEDCISREALLDKKWDVPYDGKYVQVVDVGDIKELPSVTPKKDGWIPCSERLPENDEDVLATNGIGINICWIDTDDHKWRLRNDDYIMDSVIAWMPLPEPYKEEMESKE